MDKAERERIAERNRIMLERFADPVLRWKDWDSTRVEEIVLEQAALLQALAACEEERDALVGIVLATKIRLALDAAKYDLNSLELPEGVEVTTNLGRLDMEAESKQRRAVEAYDAWQRTKEKEKDDEAWREMERNAGRS